MYNSIIALLLAIPLFFSLLNAADKKDIVYKHSPLTTNDINFIHTTDTHTWLKNKYGVDWGNYFDFLKSFRDGLKLKNKI